MSVRRTVGFRLGDVWALLTPSGSGIDLPDGYERVYFHHLRKTGGTSLIFSFLQLCGGDPHAIDRRLARFSFARHGAYRYVAYNARLINRGRYFFATSHLPAYRMNPPKEGTFRVTAFRDPVERVTSLFRYLAAPESDEGFATKAPDVQRRLAREGYDRFLDQVPRFDLLNQLYSFSADGDVDEAVRVVRSLEMVLRTERLVEGTAALSEVLGLPLQIGRQRSSRSEVELTAGQLERTREMTDPEYSMIEQIPVLHEP
ncbi:MAG: hypothetical protein ACLPVF_02070 [Acidimicrobiales bacterium]